MSNPRAGLTLIEVLVSVTLLSLLLVAMLLAMRIGFNAYAKTNSKLMADRRVAGAQRVVSEEIEGLMPVTIACTGGQASGGPKVAFLKAEPQAMRFVSAFSLQQGWRGQPRVLDMFVIPGATAGVRLVVNEAIYNPVGAGKSCLQVAPDPLTGAMAPRFPPPEPNGASFVLADELAGCRFMYLPRPDAAHPQTTWTAEASGRGWPMAVRNEMTPLEPDPSRLEPITITAPIRVHRSAEIQYVDNQ